MRFLTFLITLVLAVGLTACGKGNDHYNPDYQNFDPYASTGLYLSILPPGQSPKLNSPYFEDQKNMYENLEYAPKGLQTSELSPKYFKKESFDPPSDFPNAKVIKNAQGLTAKIGRDSQHGVPHIYGKTRPDVMFGIGYATAHDRFFLLDLLRYYGRGRLSSLIGPTAIGGFDAQSEDKSSARKAGYSEAELRAQVKATAQVYGKNGQQVLDDVKHFLAGMNYYVKQAKALPQADRPFPYNTGLLKLRDFTPRDIVAVTTLVEARFGSGGGGEIQDNKLLNGINSEFPNLSTDKKCELWHDLLETNDPDRQNTITKTFKTQTPKNVDYQACPLKPGFSSKYPGAATIDPGSYSTGGTSVVFKPCAKPGSGGSGPTCPPDGLTQSVVATDYLSNQGVGNAQSASLDLRNGALQHLASLGHVNADADLLADGIPMRNQTLAKHRVKTRIAAAVERINTLFSKKGGNLWKRSLMSNALLVGGKHTASGHPVAVFGPQVGYFEPEILFEFEAHGGGINTRGVAFPGLPYVVIGRGADFAWSATSAETDIVDTRVLKLCDNGSGYVYDGACKKFYKRVDKWTAKPLLGSGTPDIVTRTVLRAPEYGPVVGYATHNGQKVAIARQRSTFFHELDSAVGFMKMDENVVHDPKSFQKVMNTTTGTFNWFYVDDQHIAYIMAGLMPDRSNGVYPYLPQWGNGQHDWKQTDTGQLNPNWSVKNFMPIQAHPQAVDPARGYLTSWNNAPASGFRAPDSTHSWGPVQRVQALNARLKAAMNQGPITPGKLVQVMEDGGFADLRGQEVLPYALKILKQGSLTPDQQQAVDLLSKWTKDGDYPNLGSWRRDRDHDGIYDDRAAVVLMDSWYPRMIDDAMPQLVSLESTAYGNVVPMGRDNRPGATGSAYQSGYYSYMQRSFKMALGTANHPFGVLHCADGTLQGCRQALLTSLDDALSALGGISNKANWDGSQDARTQSGKAGVSVEKSDRIKFSINLNGLLHQKDLSMSWVNRPTWQQVIQPTNKRQLN